MSFEKQPACARCGYDEYTGSLHVHHVDTDRGDNRPENLVTLCANCHMALHRGVWGIEELGLDSSPPCSDSTPEGDSAIYSFRRPGNRLSKNRLLFESLQTTVWEQRAEIRALRRTFKAELVREAKYWEGIEALLEYYPSPASRAIKFYRDCFLQCRLMGIDEALTILKQYRRKKEEDLVVYTVLEKVLRTMWQSPGGKGRE